MMSLGILLCNVGHFDMYFVIEASFVFVCAFGCLRLSAPLFCSRLRVPAPIRASVLFAPSGAYALFTPSGVFGSRQRIIRYSTETDSQGGAGTVARRFHRLMVRGK
ncbi:uncharacterized protein LOC109717337 [Ananas comosus]|uniref:Uncharacterized protein LOC109717337 n=1 Tax=Ananas comosus TaxID=4615 RepID=A0A6P5G090_ANACO|nr:uncharacterized protein LOC109717337 [Ananas comosus]